jgi:CHAT domain-containing protein
MTFPDARSLLYRRLSGELTGEEKREIEEGAPSEDFREGFQGAEAEVFAAYVAGCLTLDKRERFEKHFLVSEERLEKLRVAELLYRYAKADTAKFPEGDGPWRRYFLGEMSSDEKSQIEEKLHGNELLRRRLETVRHELFAAWALKRLSDADRESFERHFLSSEEGVKLLEFAEAVWAYYECIEWVTAQADAGARRFDRIRQWLSKPVSLLVGDRNVSRPIWQPLAAVSVICVSALIWLLFFYKSPGSRGLHILYAKYAQERPVEARLTGFGYAAYRATQNQGLVKLYNDERDEAFRLIIRDANEEKSAADYQALGKAYLVYRDFNEAVARFDLALRQNPDDAKLRNDLAVALMERERAKNPGQATGEDRALALEHLHRAVELDGSLLEAQWNLALCHQDQSLWRTAEEDWKKYLEKDSSSPWAEEAKGNLAKVTGKIKQAGGNREGVYQDFLEAYRGRDAERAWGAYKRSRVSTGSFVAERLINNYLSLALSGKSTEAEEYLSALLFIGNVELRKVEDRFTYDLANFYREAGTQQLSKLSDARGLAKAATESLRRSLLGEAINSYLRAIDIFDQAGDVCESLVARSLLGHCYYQQGSPALSLPVLTKGRQESESRGYMWTRGLFLNGLANVNADQTKYSMALEHSLEQLSLARRIEDDYGVFAGISRVTDTYQLLARYQDILPMIQEGLSVADALKVGPGQIAGLHYKASKCHMASGKLLAALDYQKEAFKLSLETNNPWVISRHQLLLGMAYHKLNNNAEAVKHIRESGEVGRRLGDEKMGKEIVAFSQLHLGWVFRETGDLENALKSYGEALRLYDENGIDKQQMRFEAKKGMFVTHIKRGDAAAAEEAWKELIGLYEQHRQNIEDENSRNSFFDNEQGVYDIAIEYAYFKRQDPRRAFDLSEMSRARSLRDAIELPRRKLLEEKLPSVRLPRSTRPFDLGQIQSQLPDKTQLLQYSVLDKRLIIWVVSGADLKSVSVEIGREALDNKVNDYQQSLANGLYANQENDHRAKSSELYDLLIKPVENLLNKDAEICVIPDKALNRLPFASLFSPGSGKYLIEDHAVLMSPSANMFIVASDRARRKEGVQTEKLLAVGNPRFDAAAFRDLKDLPWAATQASEIKGFYENSMALIERDAREPDVRREIQKSDVVHFATHYIADERSPMLSLLPLAGERKSASKDNDGVLQTFEFYKLNLARPRLVVLSACQTGIEQNYKGEGAVGLARPFEAAGIPLVVASLWPVESYPTKELMVAFHRHRKSDRQSTAQALRSAQLDMIKSGSPEFRKPYHWAAYTVVGGHANF